MKIKQLASIPMLLLISSVAFSATQPIDGVYSCKFRNKNMPIISSTLTLKKTGQNGMITVYSANARNALKHHPTASPTFYRDSSTLFMRGNIGVTSFIGSSKNGFSVGTSSVKLSKDGALKYNTFARTIKKDGQLVINRRFIICKKTK